jgi:hypothetical protein
MKQLALFFLVAVVVCADAGHEIAARDARPKAEKIIYSGGDGSSLSLAIVIENAKDESAGEEAEYDWVRKRFPGFKFKSKGLVKRGDRKYDHLFGMKPDGSNADFYFDITSFAGNP